MHNNINHVLKKFFLWKKNKSVTNKTTKEVKPNYMLFKTVLETNIQLNDQKVVSNFNSILTETMYIKLGMTSWTHSS